MNETRSEFERLEFFCEHAPARSRARGRHHGGGSLPGRRVEMSVAVVRVDAAPASTGARTPEHVCHARLVGGRSCAHGVGGTVNERQARRGRSAGTTGQGACACSSRARPANPATGRTHGASALHERHVRSRNSRRLLPAPLPGEARRRSGFGRKPYVCERYTATHSCPFAEPSSPEPSFSSFS